MPPGTDTAEEWSVVTPVPEWKIRKTSSGGGQAETGSDQ